MKISTYTERIGYQASIRLQQLNARVNRLHSALQLINPAHTMARGYAILQGGGQVITSVSQVHQGKPITARVADGSFPLEVTGAVNVK